VLEEYSGTLLAHYRYGDRLLSLDAPSDGGIQYYHHDALGSTVNLTDSAGATKVSYSLDPWGHIRNQVGSSVNRQIFTGQEHDEQTGLIYFGARYYDPDTARFISQDSYLGQPGTPPSLHRYLYAYSNPTVYYDPNGHIALLKNGADALGDFNNWLRDRTDQYDDAGLVGGVGAFATGVTRGLVGASEGLLRGVNYLGNWGSMAAAGALGMDDAEWAQEHANELMATHDFTSNTYSYLKNGGVKDLANRATDTVGQALDGNAAAIGDVTELTAGLLSGGGSGAGTVSAATKTTLEVAKTATRAAVKITARMTGEVKDAGVAAGQKLLNAYRCSSLSSQRGSFSTAVKTTKSNAWNEFQMRSSHAFSSRTEAAKAYRFWKEQKWTELEGMMGAGAWPPNRGFVSVDKVTLPTGTQIDRWGGYFDNGTFRDKGRFFSPRGAAFESRSLPQSSLKLPKRAYEVVKPFDVDAGPAIPWFNQPGMGMQYESPIAIETLIKNGFIKPL